MSIFFSFSCLLIPTIPHFSLSLLLFFSKLVIGKKKKEKEIETITWNHLEKKKKENLLLLLIFVFILSSFWLVIMIFLTYTPVIQQYDSVRIFFEYWRWAKETVHIRNLVVWFLEDVENIWEKLIKEDIKWCKIV